MIRLIFIFIISSIFICCSQPKDTAKKESKVDEKKSPNIIFILTDDHGWTHTSHLADPSVEGSNSDYYETPNMDRLAKSGVMFTQGYAPNPICAPTRNSVMFGQNAARHIYAEDADWYKKTSDWFTIPRVIKKANPNYRAAHFGKWHIGMEPKVAGFDKDDGMPTNGGGEIFAESYINHGDYVKDTKEYLQKNNMPNPLNAKMVGKPSLYWSDENPKDMFGITKRAKDFMTESIKAGNPFYVQLSHYATHLSLASTKETYEYFKAKAKGDRHKSPEFAAMLKDLDTSVGMVLNFVKESGIEDNTYIFLMGDNGGRLSFNQMASLDENRKLIEAHYTDEDDRNVPLRDGKHSLYEGGLRVPFMASGPGIESNRVSNTPVTGLDLLPTFADLAGFTGDFPSVIDGGSMKPLLLDSISEKVKRSKDALYFHQSSHRPSRSAVRLGDYKLVKYWSKESKYEDTPKVQLFDISKDLSEQKDLSKEKPSKTLELENLLSEFIKETKTVTTKRDIESGVYRLMDDLGMRGGSDE
ncbi:MAG: sulfatase [Cyclobacteriaceae bacterium]|jgi:arylsulfatase A|nr:sulfatase [Cyclobacteriaceae bacterium]